MALSSYVPQRQDIAAGDTTISVRGLNLNDLSLLMAAHADKLMELYAIFEKSAEMPGGDMQATGAVVIRLVTDMPVIAGDVIALAADEPGMNAVARTLPFTTQIAALHAIGKMTFEAGGGLDSFLAALRGIGAGLGISLPPMSLPPAFQKPNGSGGSHISGETVS